jgi:hypothetical protein
VPAVTFNPSDNIAIANCLASISVGNDFVCLGEGARDDLGRHWLGHSNETYQRLLVKRIDPSTDRQIAFSLPLILLRQPQ